MSRHVPLAWLLFTAVLAAGALALFVVLNGAFGGPSVPGTGGGGRELAATLRDSQGLVTKSLVMVRGVHVGDVAKLEPSGDAVRVTLRVDPDRSPVFRDATVRVGHRTLFGEAYVDLDPGTRSAGRLPDGARLPNRSVRPTVEVDEALETLDARSRARLASLAGTGAAVASEPRSAARLSRTLDGLGATAAQLRVLGASLREQQGDLAALVQSGREVVDELSGRGEQLRTVVSAGRVSAEALTADARSLRNGLAEAAGLLGSARSALRAVDPLLREAQPTLDRTAEASPAVTSALRRLPPAVRAARRAIAALPAARRATVPTLQVLRAASPALGAAIGPLEVALRNLVPTTEYVARYRREILGFVASGEGIRALRDDGTATSGTLADTKHEPFAEMGDPGAPYGWARFFIEANTGVFTGTRSGVGDNPYPAPGDPYSDWSGSYPRLTATPAPRP